MKTGNVSVSRARLACWFFLLPLLLGLRATAFAQTDLTIYDEALAPGWQNWSWATNDLASTAHANTGSVSAAVTPAPFSALYLRAADAPVNTTGYLNLTFYVHGGTAGGQVFQVQGIIGDSRPGRRTHRTSRRGHVAEDHGAARQPRRGRPRREWLLVPGDRGRRFAHVLRRHHRARVRCSAHTAAAGQRHGYLPGLARQRLEQLELGQRQHREHDDGTHGNQFDRRHGRCL